jgi:hypothetical protein
MSATDEVTSQNTSTSDVESTVADLTVQAAYDPETGQEQAFWEGVLVVEGITTGDGREFAPESLTWADLPIPLRWNKEDSHGGEPHTVAVNVGRIDRIWRKKNQLWGGGVFNLNEEDGQRAYQLVDDKFLNGVSVDVDDVKDADIELVWPEKGPAEDEEDGEESADSIFDMLFAQPEKVIFHRGRIRAATLCDIPAFVEARIQIVDAVTAAATAATLEMFGAVKQHSTATSDGAWDSGEQEKRLPTPVPASTARAAYAWVDGTDETDGALSKSACKFIHHEVDADGSVGPANLTACSSGIGVLNGGRGGTTIPASDRRGVYDHLAAHLRDAGREPPELQTSADVMTASATVAAVDAPPSAWFSDPHLSVPTPITVLDDGRVYGHAAPWGECHVGHPDVCVTPPHEDNHPYFMTGELVTNDGARVAVGQIVTGTRHASTAAGPARAFEHYENTGYAIADIAVGNDQHGIWVAGALRPWADPAHVRALRASGQLSGDWRRIGGKLRLVGLRGVNVPGFPVPRVAARVVDGKQFSLVAAGARSFDRGLDEEQAVQVAMRRILAQVATRVRGEEAS